MTRARGFTLVEVLVALVIVAFGMGAVLASLSSAASNVAALRERTLAQWVAMNLIADVRLSLQPPTLGTVEGDVKNFGGGNWHFQRTVTAVPQVPGLLQITMSVGRDAKNPLVSSSSSSGVTTTYSTVGSIGSAFSSSGGSLMSSSGGLLNSSSGLGGSFFSSSSSSGMFALSSGSSTSSGPLLSRVTVNNNKDVFWLATMVGFRGDSVGQSTGDSPNWQTPSNTASSSGTSSSSGASSSSGSALAPVFSPGSSSGNGATSTTPLGSSTGGS